MSFDGRLDEIRDALDRASEHHFRQTGHDDYSAFEAFTLDPTDFSTQCMVCAWGACADDWMEAGPSTADVDATLADIRAAAGRSRGEAGPPVGE